MCANSAPDLSNLLQNCKLVNLEAGDLLKTNHNLSLVHRDCVLALTASKEDKPPFGALVKSLVGMLKTAHLYDNTHLVKLPSDVKKPTDIDRSALFVLLRRFQAELLRQYQHHSVSDIKPDVLTEEFKNFSHMMVLQLRRSQCVEIRYHVSKAAGRSRVDWVYLYNTILIVIESSNKSLNFRMVIISADVQTQRQVRAELPKGQKWKGVTWEVMAEDEW
jgi:hypothetical protein